ncbi:MAG: alkaline phosphatase family protein, partial [Myxococcota bacterium]
MWKAFLVLIALALFSTTAAGGPGRDIVLPGSPPYLTVFLLDGARQDVVFRELEAGRLPNIAALAEQGSVVEKGIASFPSMTGYAYYP